MERKNCLKKIFFSNKNCFFILTGAMDEVSFWVNDLNIFEKKNWIFWPSRLQKQWLKLFKFIFYIVVSKQTSFSKQISNFWIPCKILIFSFFFVARWVRLSISRSPFDRRNPQSRIFWKASQRWNWGLKKQLYHQTSTKFGVFPIHFFSFLNFEQHTPNKQQ